MEKRIVLIGAGSAQFGYGTIGDILQSKVLEGSHIVLHDINPTALAVVEENGRKFIEEHHLPYKISATTDRAEAFRGAAFVINSIEVGNRFELWEQDWRVPQQYGIRQVYGENGGPGGLFHSLRIIPPILEICADVMKISPDAFVFNYSNPMSRICTAVHRALPDLKFIGLCHEIGSLPNFLPQILGVPYEKLEVQAGGLNHFSCVLTAKYKDTGADAYPDNRTKAPAFFGNMPSLNARLGGVSAKERAEIKSVVLGFRCPEIGEPFPYASPLFRGGHEAQVSIATDRDIVEVPEEDASLLYKEIDEGIASDRF